MNLSYSAEFVEFVYPGRGLGWRICAALRFMRDGSLGFQRGGTIHVRGAKLLEDSDLEASETSAAPAAPKSTEEPR